MTIDRALRGMAGFFTLLSLALGYWVHPGFYLFTAFVGANLLQSFFTNWCPAMWIFQKAGLPHAVKGGGCCGSEAEPATGTGGGCCGSGPEPAAGK